MHAPVWDRAWRGDGARECEVRYQSVKWELERAVRGRDCRRGEVVQMWEGGRWEQSAPLLVLPLTVEQAALAAPTNKAKVLENEEFFRIAWEYQFNTAEMPHSNTVTWRLKRAATTCIVSLELNDDFATLRRFLNLDSIPCSGVTTAKFAKLIGSRSGGVYMPPARLCALQAAASSDKSSPEYQRMSRDALRKSITGIVNRVNITNIKQVVPELFAENLIRGRGLFARSVMRAQAASLPFTPVFAALVAILNSKLPQVGEQVLTRLISQFRWSFKRIDKVGQFSPSFVIITDSCPQIVCHSLTTFIAHLVNQSVAHEIIAPTFSIGWKPSHTK